MTSPGYANDDDMSEDPFTEEFEVGTPLVDHPGFFPTMNRGGLYGDLPTDAKYTDLGNSRLFVGLHKDKIRWAGDARMWYVWDGIRWVRGADTMVLGLAQETVLKVRELALAVPDRDEQNRAFRWYISSGARSRIEAIAPLARGDQRINVSAGMFDSNPYLLNVPNGVVDLHNGDLRSHSIDDYMSHMAGVDYDPDATCPKWLSFLKWVTGGDAELEELLWMIAGHATTGLADIEKVWVLDGSGQNGKSTYIGVLEGLLGSYALRAAPDLLAVRRSGAATNDMAELHGKRLVVASEVRSGERWDERAVKHIASTDSITARFMYKDFFTFKPTHTAMFAVNMPPTIRDSDEGIWRRLPKILFAQRVADADKIYEYHSVLLKEEGPGILAWAVQAAIQYLATRQIRIPTSVIQSSDAYRKDQDLLQRFADECIVVDENGFMTSKELKAAYRRWCEAESLDKDQIVLMSTMETAIERKLGISKVRQTPSEGRRVGFPGVRLQNGPIMHFETQ